MTSIIDTEQAREGATVPPSGPPPAPEPSARVAFGWVAVVVVFAAAMALAVVVLQSAGSSDRSDAPASYRQFPQGVPGSADAAEHWLTERSAWPKGVPHSADAADRWLTPDRELPNEGQGTPQSPDAVEHWLTDAGR